MTLAVDVRGWRKRYSGWDVVDGLAGGAVGQPTDLPLHGLARREAVPDGSREGPLLAIDHLTRRLAA